MAQRQGVNLPVNGVLGRVEGTETIFEAILSEKIPNLIKTEFTNSGTQRTPNTKNMQEKSLTPGNIKTKLFIYFTKA